MCMFLNANSVNFANVNFQGRKLETTRNLTKIAKKNVTITPERKAIIDNNKNIVKLMQKGFSLKEIAEKLKLNLYELYNYSRANRIKQIHFADRNQEIMELYKKGTPVSDIAKKFNLSESFIRGLACFNSQPRRIISKEAILKKLQEGAPISEIIETFNVSKGTIRNISVQTGIIQNKLVNRNIKIINGLLKSTSKEDMASQFVFLDKIYKNSREVIIC